MFWLHSTLPSFATSRGSWTRFASRSNRRARATSRFRLGASSITTVVTFGSIVSTRSLTVVRFRARSRTGRRATATTRGTARARARRWTATTTRRATAARSGTRTMRWTANFIGVLNDVNLLLHMIENLLTSRSWTRWPFNSRSFNFLRAYSISSRTWNSTILGNKAISAYYFIHFLHLPFSRTITRDVSKSNFTSFTHHIFKILCKKRFPRKTKPTEKGER